MLLAVPTAAKSIRIQEVTVNLFKRCKGLTIHSSVQLYNTKPCNYSHLGQSRVTQQDGRDKWLEGNTLDAVVQDRVWLTAKAAGPSAQPPQLYRTAVKLHFFEQSLTGNLCSVKTALSCCLQHARNLSPSAFQDFRKNLYLHYTLQAL